MPKIDRTILESALLGIEAQKQRLDEKAAEIRQMLNGNQPASTAAASEAAPRKRKPLSAAARWIAARYFTDAAEPAEARVAEADDGRGYQSADYEVRSAGPEANPPASDSAVAYSKENRLNARRPPAWGGLLFEIGDWPKSANESAGSGWRRADAPQCASGVRRLYRSGT